jgi:hypothetical protein
MAVFGNVGVMVKDVGDPFLPVVTTTDGIRRGDEVTRTGNGATDSVNVGLAPNSEFPACGI